MLIVSFKFANTVELKCYLQNTRTGNCEVMDVLISPMVGILSQGIPSHRVYTLNILQFYGPMILQ